MLQSVAIRGTRHADEESFHRVRGPVEGGPRVAGTDARATRHGGGHEQIRRREAGARLNRTTLADRAAAGGSAGRSGRGVPGVAGEDNAGEAEQAEVTATSD